MNEHEELDGLRRELARWQQRFDELRLQAKLGKMELKDKLDELEEQLEPAGRQAKDRLLKIAWSGANEVRVLADSLGAGWDALQRTHRELKRETKREREAEAEQRRHG